MKRFDRKYFDKWYRSPTHKIGTRADLARQVHLAVAAAEYMLTRPIRSVLDVGAGEGRWEPLIHEIRPSAKYIGVDPSEYVVKRFGARRNIHHGTLDDLDTLFPTKTFDLVVCCSVLNYLPREAFIRALSQLAKRTHGVAFLEIFAREDEVVGDTNTWHVAPAAEYRRLLKRAGFVACGMHCYITESLIGNSAALERSTVL
jgi:SAM-dependent methyltransferase